MPSRERVADLIAMVQQGRFVEAIEAFYAQDATMQENLGPPRCGRDTLLAHEKRMLGSFEWVRARAASPYLVEGDNVVIHWLFEGRMRDGSTYGLDELAWQRWHGDRIVEERFYYDPAARRPGPAENAEVTSRHDSTA